MISTWLKEADAGRRDLNQQKRWGVNSSGNSHFVVARSTFAGPLSGRLRAGGLSGLE